MTSLAVEIRGLRRDFGSRTALAGIDLDVRSGELFGLLGPNGGGKTTLCRILSTSSTPSAGDAKVCGHDVRGEAAAVRAKIGVVFQYPSLDKKLTVVENMRHQGHLYGLSGSELSRRIEEMLGRVKLLDRRNELVETLSGGLRRRVELAKGLLHRPRLLILDEPSTGLDPGARQDLWDYLASLKKDGTTILVATHLMEEAEHCGRLAIMDQGKIVALGSPEELKAEIGGDVIRIEAGEPELLRKDLRDRFGIEALVLDGGLRFEKDQAHSFIPSLIEAFPGRIQAVTLGKPTLEDVFIKRTSHRFWRKEGRA